MSSSISTNENTASAADSLARSYYSSQLQQQQHLLHQQSHYQTQQFNNHHHILHQPQQQIPTPLHYNGQPQQQIQHNTYSHANFPFNGQHHQQQIQIVNNSNGHSLHQGQHYQHPPLSNVFPSIYAENIYKANVDLALNHLNQNANFSNHHNGSTNNSINIMMSSSSSPSPSLTTTSGGGGGGGGGSANGNGNHYSTVQRQIQQDWSNREYIEVVISNIKKLTDFLNSFELSCRSKLAMLDEKLTKLERQIDFVEARVTKGDTLN